MKPFKTEVNIYIFENIYQKREIDSTCSEIFITYSYKVRKIQLLTKIADRYFSS